MKSKTWIKALKDQAIKAGETKPTFFTHVITTILIILSGILLYLDKGFKYLGIHSNYTAGYEKFTDFIWVFMQSIAPLVVLLVLYFYIKRNKWVVFLPVYCYGLQIIWIFSPQYSDDFLGYFYALGVCLAFFLSILILKKTIILLEQKKTKDQQFITNYSRAFDKVKKELINEAKSGSL